MFHFIITAAVAQPAVHVAPTVYSAPTVAVAAAAPVVTGERFLSLFTFSGKTSRESGTRYTFRGR